MYIYICIYGSFRFSFVAFDLRRATTSQRRKNTFGGHLINHLDPPFGGKLDLFIWMIYSGGVWQVIKGTIRTN